jgi:hypothetical protein
MPTREPSLAPLADRLSVPAQAGCRVEREYWL